MEKINVTVINVRVMKDVKDQYGVPSVMLKFDKEVPVIREGDSEETLNDTIFLNSRSLTKQLINLDVDVMTLFGVKGLPYLDQASYAIVLQHSKLTLVRTRVHAGDAMVDEDGQPVVDDDGVARTYDFEGFSTKITSLQVGNKSLLNTVILAIATKTLED